MSASVQRPNSDHAFRSITTFIHAIEKSTSRTKDQFVFSDTKDELTPEDRQQLRVNTALSVCAVREWEVIAVLSSSKKTAAGISTDYIVTVNPKILNDNGLLDDILHYQTSEPDNAIPRSISGKGENLKNLDDVVRARL